MKSKNEMTLETTEVTCTNSCQHAINFRSSPFVNEMD